MKKSVRIIALCVVAVMVCLALASCGKTLSGEYYMGDKTITKSYTTLNFKGNKVTVDAYVLGNKVTAESYEAKYEIKDGNITMTWKDANGEEKSSTQTFVENEDGSIKIGVVTYNKTEK